MSDDILIENQKNQSFIEQNLDSLRKVFLDKYIIVHNQQVIAGFPSFQEASEYGVTKFGLKDAFLIYHVEDIKPVNFVVHAKSIDYASHNQTMRQAIL